MKNRGIVNNNQSDRDFFFYDPLILNSLNFILNLILHQNSLYSQSRDDGYLIDFQEKFTYILKRIDESSNDYRLIFRFANFYQNKKEEVADTHIVALNSLSNPYIIKFINSSLNILVFLGKLNELCTSQRNDEAANKKITNFPDNKNNTNDKSIVSKNKNMSLIFDNNNNKKSQLQNVTGHIGVLAGEKIIDKITSNLNDNNRDDIMLKCINIPNINIKRKIMEILLTVDYDQISGVEFEGLVNTLKNSNFLDMNMEDIVTKSFLFIIRLLNHKIKKKEDRLIRTDNAIECGIKLALESNTRNYFTDENKFKSAQNLNLILSVFLINLSTERKFDKIYSNKEMRDNFNEKKQNHSNNNFLINQNLESIKKIIFSEYESVKKISENNQELVRQMFPLNYEKIYAMWNVNNIRDFLINYSIYPFNFIVFRLFRHMADMLMNVPYPVYNVFEEKEKLDIVIEKLKKEFKEREVEAVEAEKKNWSILERNKSSKFKNSKLNAESKLNQNFVNKQNELQNSKSATNLNFKGFENLINIVETRSQFISLSDETWKEQRLLFFDKFRDFLNFLCGEPHFVNEVKTRLEDYKYDYRLKNPDQSASGDKGSEEHERFKADLYWGTNESNSLNNESQRKNSLDAEQGFLGRMTNLFNKNDAEDQNANLNQNDNNNKVNCNKTASAKQRSEINISNLEPVIKTYLQTIDKSSSKNNSNFDSYSHIKEDLREECDVYGRNIERVFRQKEHETVDNCYLRSLIVAAFLRCVFALTKNADKKSNNSYSTSAFGRFNLVNTLRNPYFFQKLILLVDSTKMQYCNINTKILIIIKHVFEKISKDFADIGSGNSEKKSKANNNNNKNTKGNEIRNAGIGASKHDFSRLINISSIIIEKTLDNIYFNQRAFAHDVSEESYTVLVRKLVKCCLCIKKEIFKMNLSSDENKDLLQKILSTRLILVLINHALKIMENDIPLQKQLQNQENNNEQIDKNKGENIDKEFSDEDIEISEDEINNNNNNDNNNYKNTRKLPEDIEYNEYLVDLLILLAEFISCRKEVYIIVIEYVCKKYYIQKKAIRQSFIKDLADLRNYSYSSRLQTNKANTENYDNISFISVSQIIFAYSEDKNKSLDLDTNKINKINQKIIKNEICILILDQSNLVIKRFNHNKKILDFSDIEQAKTLANLCVKDEVKEIRYFPYGNRIFLRQKDNRYLMSFIFKKSIESYLFLSALKNIEKKLEFKTIDSVLNIVEDSDLIKENMIFGDDIGYGYGMCGKTCYNSLQPKDAAEIDKKIKRSRSRKNNDLKNNNNINNNNNNEEANFGEDDKSNIKIAKTKITKISKNTKVTNNIKANKNEDQNNLEIENQNNNQAIDHENEKPNFVRKKIGSNNARSEIRSVSSNIIKKNENINNVEDKKSKITKNTLRRNNDNNDNKTVDEQNNINFIEQTKNFIIDNKLTGEEKFKYLKEVNQKRVEEKSINKLNKSITSAHSNASIRSKSGKMMSVKLLKKKLSSNQNEENDNDNIKNKENQNKIDVSKYTFNDKIFLVAIDFSSFSHVDDLNEEALYRNIYIMKLIGNDSIKIFKEKEKIMAQLIVECELNKNSLEEELYNEIGNAIQEINHFNLESVRNILFDNRKIIIEFKNSVNYIFSRPIQIYPLDDRGFFYLRNFFVRFIYMKGFQNVSKNFLTEAISTRIFKN